MRKKLDFGFARVVTPFRPQSGNQNGCNYIVVMPELHTVYATAGRRYNRPDALEPLVWLGNRLLPAW